MATGTPAMNRVLLAIGSLPSTRLFRNNVGLGWVGKATKLGGGRVLITDARPLHAGLVVGSGDLIGWTTREITAADIGKRVAIFTSLESKSGTGRAETEQRRWIDNVRAAGGIAGVVRCEEDAQALLAAAPGIPAPCRV